MLDAIIPPIDAAIPMPACTTWALSIGGLVKLSFPLVALCTLILAACNAGSDGEPMAAPDLDTPTPTVFTPQELTAADIPPDIHDDSLARLPMVMRDSLDADGQRASLALFVGEHDGSVRRHFAQCRAGRCLLLCLPLRLLLGRDSAWMRAAERKPLQNL